VTLLLVAALTVQLGAPIGSARFRISAKGLDVPDVGTIRYGLALPGNFDAQKPRPLVLALHPGGGGNVAFYGSQFMQQIVAPALSKLSDLEPIIIAPDCPARSWSDPAAEKGVLALIDHIFKEYAIDRKRILVTGFSLGGHGTWFFEAHHADLFTGAIVMAGATRNESQDGLARIPTYIIHGTADTVVPFGPAEKNARDLEQIGRPVKFEALDGVNHYNMGYYIEPLTRAARWISERWDK
jgi:predicted peptidase